MNVNLENDAIYVQLMNNIKEKIINGEYKVGDRIMSERSMAETYGINRLTVRRALRHLEEEGCIKAIQGRGTFVCSVPKFEKKVLLGTGENVSLKATIKMGGMKSSRVVLDFGRIKAVDDIKDCFPDSDEVYRLVRLSFVNDHPYAVQEAYFPCNLFQDAERFNFAEASLYDYMDMYGHCPIKVISYLQVKEAPKEYSEYLHMEEGSKMFFFDYYGFDAEHKITEYTKSYHRPEYTAVRYITEIK